MGTTPDTATVIVIPTFTQEAACFEMRDTFLIIVDPIPVVNSSANITICSGESVNYSLVSNVTGTTYSWTSSDAEGSIGGNKSGSGISINDTLTNFGENDGIVVYEITPYGPSPSSCEAPKFYLTVKVVNCNPLIGVSKQLVSTQNNNDGTFNAKFNIRVQNYGNVVLNNIQVTEDLTTRFGGSNYQVIDLYSTSFDVDTTFNGNSNINLLNNGGTINSLASGASTNIVLEIRILTGGTYNNQVTASASTIAGNVTDLSTNGSDPDPDGDTIPGNNSVLTPVSDCTNTIAVTSIAPTQCNAAIGSITISATQGGTVTLSNGASATDISEPYQFVFNNLPAGFYTASATGECNDLEIYVLNSNSTLAATVAVNNIACYGGTVTAVVTATGGTAPYRFSINGAATVGSVTNTL
jgi:hypothetical protein